jgi:hypothetical protein
MVNGSFIAMPLIFMINEIDLSTQHFSSMLELSNFIIIYLLA